jgi:hypothetical protein
MTPSLIHVRRHARVCRAGKNRAGPRGALAAQRAPKNDSSKGVVDSGWRLRLRTKVVILQALTAKFFVRRSSSMRGHLDYRNGKARAAFDSQARNAGTTMIKSTTMETLAHSAGADFWSDVYRDRPIAIFNRHGRLYVYLDHILQHNVVFESGQDALAWLIQRIDQGVPARLN